MRRASPTRGCGASPATRGTPSSAWAARPAAPARRSRPAPRRWPAARTSAARSASRRRSTASSASSRRTAGCRSMPPFNLDTYCHCGPLARTVADCRAVRERAGRARPVATSSRCGPSSRSPSSSRAVDGLRIARLRATSATGRSTPRCARNTLDVGRRRCASAGATVEEVDLRHPAGRHPARHRRSTSRSIFGDWIGRGGRRARRPDDAPTRSSSARWAQAAGGGGIACSRGWRSRRELYAPVGALLERYDALICPTVGTRGLVAGDDYVDHGLEVGGEQLDFYFESILTPLFNVAQPLPGAERAVRVRRQRRADRDPDRRPHLRRRDAVPGRRGAASAARPWFDAAERRPEIAAADA